MPRKKPGEPPVYPSKPHASGQARIRLDGRDHYLGVWGTAESRLKYAELIDRWRRGEGVRAVAAPVSPRTVADVAAMFLDDARRTRRKPDGSPTKEVANFPYAVEALCEQFADLPAERFGAAQLLDLRDSLPARGWGRRYANRQLTRIKTLFRWAELRQLVPAGTFAALRAVPGLPRRNDDDDELPPVPEDDLAATLPFLGHVVRDIVPLQLLTGARVGEALSLRPRDFIRGGSVEVERGVYVDTSAVWLVRLREHKNAWRGQKRYLFFGPKAQELITPYLDRPAESFLFSPREAATRWLEEEGRDVENWLRSRNPGDRYTADSYRAAVQRGCDRADADAKREARKAGLKFDPKSRLVCRWCPAQLRHNAATRLCSEFGPEVARIVLGHRDLGITRRYVADDLQKASSAIARFG